MKKLIILALLAVIMAGCLGLNSKPKKVYKILCDNVIYYTSNGCEYYIYENYHGGIPVHKEDCKKCKVRRKAELKELVEQLKDK